MGLTASATGQKGKLTPSRHLITPPVFLGVRVIPFISLFVFSLLGILAITLVLMCRFIHYISAVVVYSHRRTNETPAPQKLA
jgi:hypothetical protein